MRAPAGIEANDARVFFRLFRTVATGFEYQAATYPRIGDGTTAVPMHQTRFQWAQRLVHMRTWRNRTLEQSRLRGNSHRAIDL